MLSKPKFDSLWFHAVVAKQRLEIRVIEMYKNIAIFCYSYFAEKNEKPFAEV